MKTTDRITIIPDVHGRPFWKEPVMDIGEVPAVFLGDYLDPYPEEKITKADALADFREILALKEAHPDQVALLLGNHDLHYILTMMGGGRTDHERFESIRDLLVGNLDLFDMALEMESDDHRYLFTHAGVLKGWLERNDGLRYGDFPESVGARMNYMLHDGTWMDMLLWALCDTGPERGGLDPFGSPVWADVREYDQDRFELDGIFQVFGHTWMEEEVITPCWACLDCGRAFMLNTDTNLIERKK